jgi:arylsulfatase A-like enzyme
MIASWPQRIAGGRSASPVAVTMDLFPTICAAAGVSVEHPIDGRSLLPTLLGGSQKFDRDLVWMRIEGRKRMGREWYAIRRGDWKIVQEGPFSPYQLFNLREDPREETDVRGEPNDEVFTRMNASLQHHIRRAGGVPWQRPAP